MTKSVNAEINKSKNSIKIWTSPADVNKDTDLRSHVYGSTNTNHWKSEIRTEAYPMKSFRLQSSQWMNEISQFCFN